MSTLKDRAERQRRWGWVAVALGIPGAIGLATYAYLMVVEGVAPLLMVVVVLGALAAPLALGARAIVGGYRLEDEGEGRATGASAAESASEPRASGVRAGGDPSGVSPARTLAWALAFLLFGGLAAALLVPVTACACSTREKAYLAAMKSDLKNLTSQQEIYFADRYSYTSSVSDLAFTNSDGVMVTIVASANGWTARATHQALGADVACVVAHGDVERPMRTAGGVVAGSVGAVTCDD